MPTLDDLQKQALIDQGYSGTVDDMTYQWLFDQCEGGGGGPVYPPSNDPNIIWSGDEFIAEDIDASQAIANIYFYTSANGIPTFLPEPFDSTVGYFYPEGTPGYQRVIAAAVTPWSSGQYIIKYKVVEIVEGDGNIALNYAFGREDEWWEAATCNIDITTTGPAPIQECVCEVSVATLDSGDPNAGTAVPVAGSESTRRVRFIARVEP